MAAEADDMDMDIAEVALIDADELMLIIEADELDAPLVVLGEKSAASMMWTTPLIALMFCRNQLCLLSFERTARMILAVLPPLVTYAPVELTVNVTAASSARPERGSTHRHRSRSARSAPR